MLKMNFSMLPPEIKIEIFNFLPIGSRYNASLVWEDMRDEFRRSIPTDGELIRRLKDPKQMLGISFNDIETGGVLASMGDLDSAMYLVLKDTDVSSVPINIFNSFAKIASESIWLDNVTGLSYSMLENVKCKWMGLRNLCLEASAMTQHISDNVINNDRSGEVSELLNNIHITKDFLQTNEIQIRPLAGNVQLERISGDVCGLLSRINCDELTIADMGLSCLETRVLTEMLKSRIKSLVLRHNVTIIHFTFLDDYDGKGRCEKIEFDGTIDIDRYLAASWTWADSVGWKVTEKRNKIILEKERTLQNSLKD